MEEWLVVLSGSPTLRGPDGERVLRAGDVVCFPTGPEGAPPGDAGPGSVLILSASQVARVDRVSRTAARSASRRRAQIFRLADEVDYWEGE